MTPPRKRLKPDRRAFLVASGTGFAGLCFGSPRAARAAAGPTAGGAEGGRADSTILFFLCGGASHVDTWDMKPAAPAEYRGPFSPIETASPGMTFCEHLPLLAKQAGHLAVVNSVCGTVNTNDHHAGYYHQLTGHVPDATFLSQGNDRRPYADDWPFIGSVVGQRTARRSPTLPAAITLPHKPSKAPYTRPGQFAARLGVEFDPLYVNGSLEEPLKFEAPSLVLTGDMTPAQLQSRRHLLERLDGARRGFDSPAGQAWKGHQRRSLELLLSAGTAEAFDVARERQSVRDRYGGTVNGMSLLLARRLVEARVPFVTVFWKENEAIAEKCKSAGGWDTHGNNFGCLKENLLPEFDRGFSALVEDLHERGLLPRTLLLVTSEMGRTPKIGDPRSGGLGGAGRDHWTHCMSVLMAGGGVRGGRVYGASDRFGEYAAEHPVTPADVAKTVYHAMGIRDLQAEDPQGRPYHLLEEGRAITELFG